MARSKRDKKVSLTKTTKKGSLVLKQQFTDTIRKSVEEYEHIFVFSVKDMRNSKLKDVRDIWKHSRFYFGKNSIMQLGLGKTKETEAGLNLHKLASKLNGQCGLLFTNKSREEVVSWFAEYSDKDYARAGTVATETVVLPAGPLEQFPFSIETHLRQLGMPTELDKGVVKLLQEYTVCTRGDVLKPEQTKILKLLDIQMAEFRLTLKCVWSKDGTFKRLKKGVALGPLVGTPMEEDASEPADTRDEGEVEEEEIEEIEEEEIEEIEEEIEEIEEEEIEEIEEEEEIEEIEVVKDGKKSKKLLKT